MTWIKTTFYTKTEIDVALSDKASVSDIPNFNFIENSNFKVNPRGESAYGASGATVSRWISNGNGTVEVVDGGVILTKTNDSPFLFSQWLENVEEYKGKTVTIGVDTGGKTLLLTFDIPDSGDFDSPNISFGDGFYLDLIGAGNGTVISIRVLNPSSGSRGTLSINHIKGEFGRVSSPYVPPSFAINRLECERFYMQRYLGNFTSLVDGPFFYIPHTEGLSRMRLESPTVRNLEDAYLHRVGEVSPIAIPANTQWDVNAREGISILVAGLTPGAIYSMNNSPQAGNYQWYRVLFEIDAEIYG